MIIKEVFAVFYLLEKKRYLGIPLILKIIVIGIENLLQRATAIIMLYLWSEGFPTNVLVK